MKDASRALPAMVIALIAVVAFAVLPVLSDTVNADDGSVGTSFDITGKRARDIEGGIQVYIDAIAKSGGGIATIVGSKNNANAIDILVWSTVTVVWKAEYSGETETALIKVRGTGTFEIADGAEIEAERIAITVNGGASLVISGGSVTAERCVVHVNDGTVKMTGGTVTADDKDGFAIHIPGTGAAAYLPGICSGDLDTGPNGSIAAVDTLAIPGERHGTSEGLTFKAGGVDAVWDLSSERPVISFSNGYQIEWGEAALMPITVAEIPVPAPPAAGAVPAANIETEQYT
ncbi:MAG: hypothetical protein LBI08_00905, partial [Methanomassiliicoccaceae archaeon]|nr:hypothetical protein [Methanomassiliicoccaceae archaeon]